MGRPHHPHPDALAYGAELRADAMVTKIAIDQRAATVAVAGYSIESG